MLLVKIFKDNDKDYYEFIKKHHRSFVFNYFQSSSIENNKFHRAYCESLPNPWSGKKTTTVKKVVSGNYFELVRWMNENIGIENKDYSKCQNCNPNT